MFSNITVTYGNNVTLASNSWIDANRQTSTSAAGNIINLGTLTVSGGTKVLNVDSGNNYQVGFASLDGPGTLLKAGGGRLNINAIAGTFSGNIGIAGPWESPSGRRLMPQAPRTSSCQRPPI